MSDDAPVSEDDEGELNEVDPELIETIEEIDSDLIKLQEENASVIADMQRIKADFDNYRRQTAKRQVDLLEQAASSLVEKLLPALDACDAAIQQGAEDIIPVRNALVETLEDNDIEFCKLSNMGDFLYNHFVTHILHTCSSCLWK